MTFGVNDRTEPRGPTVSGGYVRALVDLAESQGADRATLLKRTGTAATVLDDPDARVPFDLFRSLMREAGVLCGEPAFGLHFGERTRFVDMSIVGLICHAASTMGEAFEQLNRFARLAVEVDGHETAPRFALVRDPEGLWLEERRRHPNDFPELTESTFARFVCDTRRHFPEEAFALELRFTHPRPGHAAEYDRIFNAPIRFGADRNAIRIAPSWLDIRLGPPNRYVFGVFSEKAQALMAELEASRSMRGLVEAALAPVLHTGEIGMTDTARRMCLSRAGLYRRLKAEGVSYEAVLDDLRRRMALHYLDGRKVSVNEAGYLVGFSDPSAFSRAFKRWTGERPGRRGS